MQNGAYRKLLKYELLQNSHPLDHDKLIFCFA